MAPVTNPTPRSRPVSHHAAAVVAANAYPTAHHGRPAPDISVCPRLAVTTHTAANTAARARRKAIPEVMASIVPVQGCRDDRSPDLRLTM